MNAQATAQPNRGTSFAVPSDTEIGLVLDRLATWLRRTTPAVEWNSVSLSTLDRLARGGPHRVTDLVAAERITQPGMTGQVARLEAAGLVSRCADPDDGRATLVSITDHGRVYLAGLHQERAAIIASRLRDLSREQRGEVAGAIKALDALAALTPIVKEEAR